MAQVGMRMPPGGGNSGGGGQHHLLQQHPPSQNLHHHPIRGGPAMPPHHHSQPQHHIIQNSNRAPNILRRMPHHHQQVQTSGGHSHSNHPTSNHLLMNQYAPPPHPAVSVAGVVGSATQHVNIPPTSVGSNSLQNGAQSHPPTYHQHQRLVEGSNNSSSRNNNFNHRQQTSSKTTTNSTRVINGSHNNSQYSRPPPPLVPVLPSSGKDTTVINVGNQHKQKNKEIKEKTPMCLVNELARFNKIEHHYKLTDETGPAHKKSFTVCLKIGDKEDYIASGPSIKKAQHAAAAISLEKTKYEHPAPKVKNKTNNLITPTVELNGLAMKLGETPLYEVSRKVQQNSEAKNNQVAVYIGKLKIDNQEFTAEGASEKSAKHNVASVALTRLKLTPTNALDSKIELDPTSTPFVPGVTEHDDLKSPISLVHELALKRNFDVEFTVVQESGQPHIRIFITMCSVGNFVTKGEGNSKKASKKAAAELMLANLRKMPPFASAVTTKPKPTNTKKKSKNLIKADTAESSESKQSINPISRLIQIQQAKKEKEPVYTMIDERGLPRRREFFIKVSVGNLSAVGSGPNKKVAKRAAAENFLQQTGYSRPSAPPPSKSSLKTSSEPSDLNSKKLTFKDEVGRSDADVLSGGSSGRQVVPGIIYLDDKARNGHVVNDGDSSSSTHNLNSSQTKAAKIAKELLDAGTSPTADQIAKAAVVTSCGSSSLPQPLPLLPTSGQGVSSKEQLAYLSQILGFTVTYNHFPKKGEYLTVVSLSTNPPQICHGTGHSLEISHNNAAHNALKALAANGLDNIDKDSK